MSWKSTTNLAQMVHCSILVSVVVQCTLYKGGTSDLYTITALYSTVSGKIHETQLTEEVVNT